MRFKLVLGVFAEQDVTGEMVELAPGGLVEEHETLDDLLFNVGAICEQGWGDLSRRQVREFFERIDH